MGYKSVAVFPNDYMYQIENDKFFGEKLAKSSRSFSAKKYLKEFRDCLGNKGEVISVTHVSDTPVLVIQDYTGYDIREEENDKILMVNDEFLRSGLPAMKDFLERNGFKVTKKRSRKKPIDI